MSLKKLTNITKNQIANKGVQALANRPNVAQQYGVAGLSPMDLKLWFDKLATFLAEKINEVQNAISADDAASYIRVALDQYGVASLDDLIRSMQDGSFAQNILYIIPPTFEDPVSLSNFLTDLCQKLSKAVEEISKKLDKNTTKDGVQKVYSVDGSGNQVMLPVKKAPDETDSIPIYVEGKLKSKTPESAQDVVNKEYFENILKSYVSGTVYNEGVKGLSQKIDTVSETLQNEIDKIDSELGIAQSMGDSKYSVMSQWATTNAINRLDKRVMNIESFCVIDPSEIDNSIAYAKHVPEGALSYAEITKIGGMTYRDEATNTLKDAAVTKIRATGKNLLPFPYYKSNQTMSGVTFVANNDGGIAVSGTPTANAYIAISNRIVISGLDYICVSLQGEFSNISLEITLYNKDREAVYSIIEGVTQKKINLSSDYPNAHSMTLTIKRMQNNVVCSGTVYPMINIGSDYLPHELYKESALEIPAAVQALNGYRLGIDETYNNHIIWNPSKKITTWNKSANKAIFDGSEDWKLLVSQAGSSLFYVDGDYAGDVKTKGKYGYGICNHYTFVEDDLNPELSCRFQNNNGNRIYFVDSNYTNVEDWKARVVELYESGNPLTLVYLITKTSTDISDILSDDNIIEVHEGGVVIAENEHGLDVPTTIVYQTEGITSMFPDGDEVSY